jgi:hypothetical protein
VKEDGTMRAHLGLRIPKECGIRIAGDLHRWKEGEAIVIEGGIDHEAANLSQEPRIVLLIDFDATPEEWAYTVSAIRDIDRRWFEGGMGAGLYGLDELASGECYTGKVPASW